MESSVGWTKHVEPNPGFILNMTSDAKVRGVVDHVSRLSNITTSPPEMGWYDLAFDPAEDSGPFLPFTVYLITGTAGAGKSTSISALYQNLNCLITGATTIAAQNLSRRLKTFCPTIFSAFGFKSRHINIAVRKAHQTGAVSIEQIQQQELSKYWPVIVDIMKEVMAKKPNGMYGTISNANFETLSRMTGPCLWTSNIIVIDEAGTLSSYILTTVVFFYWFLNSWLNTPLYRQGAVPCIVCVGSPTQTNAFQSTYNHGTQKTEISSCENILTFMIGKKVVSEYVHLERNWALFINNKRCTDLQFGHLLKILEYNLPIPDEVMSYVDRFVVPKSKIMDPLEYIGWTRLFLSHSEVKAYLTNLHTCLTLGGDTRDTKLFTCPVVCEVFVKPFEEYKRAVNLTNLTVTEWVTKNLFKLSNYSQFVDQDMSIVATESTERSTQVTFITKFVKNSHVSLNGKTKKCICGFQGTYFEFKRILDSELFVETHSQDRPEYVYGFLNTLLYNAMYSFHAYGVTRSHEKYLQDLKFAPLPAALATGRVDLQTVREELNLEDDIFYHVCSPPPPAGITSLQVLVDTYCALKDVFASRIKVACRWFGGEFEKETFSAFTVNMVVRDGVDFVSPSERLNGLLAFASTVESYKIKGYTFLPVAFGRCQGLPLSDDLRKKMPSLVVQDSSGFIACLENNITKLTETMEDGSVFQVCCAGDYGVSSNLAMTIVKAQGMSLERVAVVFGSHKNVQTSHVYVAISRAVNSNYLVMDSNPLKTLLREPVDNTSAKHIVRALHNPNTTLIY
ncbi:helicase/primase [Macaca mulatta rhadinovirus 17577]|uniref:Helicase-primase n=2 Tax=Macacine gammaherpesvirus 5 TaxID=154334 RepID=Q77NJ2_9GAMA|nr:helicase/primase [Macacine gammaherpesvirus 5]AAD21371.1 helicase/primase [Macaca mulatta rhadinovirus 17577]AAF60023.1 helicase-primase [Rhesus monkey rhadinovirus H26-95]WUF06338.1 helicase/primase [synthetic construct]WVG99645.1 helicase/primase [Macaca mulatta rhadinovirus]QFN51629.1 ORF 44 [Macacine gammaherpesvirus 5]